MTTPIEKTSAITAAETAERIRQTMNMVRVQFAGVIANGLPPNANDPRGASPGCSGQEILDALGTENAAILNAMINAGQPSEG